MAANGYPGSYAKGSVIAGLDDAAQVEGVRDLPCRHQREGGTIVANGGRVLNVTALGKTVARGAERAYAAVDRDRLAGRFLPPRHRLAGRQSRSKTLLRVLSSLLGGFLA